MKVFTGLDVLIKDKNIQKSFNGNVALLCHNASIDSAFTHSALKFKEIFGSRFVKLFGPQHGFATDVQDKMSLAFALDTPINTIQYYEQINDKVAVSRYVTKNMKGDQIHYNFY